MSYSSLGLMGRVQVQSQGERPLHRAGLAQPCPEVHAWALLLHRAEVRRPSARRASSRWRRRGGWRRCRRSASSRRRASTCRARWAGAQGMGGVCATGWIGDACACALLGASPAEASASLPNTPCRSGASARSTTARRWRLRRSRRQASLTWRRSKCAARISSRWARLGGVGAGVRYVQGKGGWGYGRGPSLHGGGLGWVAPG